MIFLYNTGNLIWKKGPGEIDFSQFWFKFRTPNGRVTHDALFDTQAFAEQFGQSATNAFDQYRHYTGNPKDERGKKILADAIRTLNNIGLDPKVIDAAQKKAKVEEL